MNAYKYERNKDTPIWKSHTIINMLTTLNISDKLIINIWRGGVMSVIFKGKYNIKSIIMITVFSLIVSVFY